MSIDNAARAQQRPSANDGVVRRAPAAELLLAVVDDPAPSADLIRAVRAGFTLLDSSLGNWCKQNHVDPSAARMALAGAWDGPKGKRLRKRIVRAAGLEVAP